MNCIFEISLKRLCISFNLVLTKHNLAITSTFSSRNDRNLLIHQISACDNYHTFREYGP